MALRDQAEISAYFTRGRCQAGYLALAWSKGFNVAAKNRIGERKYMLAFEVERRPLAAGFGLVIQVIKVRVAVFMRRGINACFFCHGSHTQLGIFKDIEVHLGALRQALAGTKTFA